MQLLAKFEKILYMGLRATLNFGKFKVTLLCHENNTNVFTSNWAVF